jgi:hypothetical protein
LQYAIPFSDVHKPRASGEQEELSTLQTSIEVEESFRRILDKKPNEIVFSIAKLSEERVACS